tara:strand:+ start:141 stop:578 length:438 start_codon:yes stop_codon:yes gene_type:complete
MSKIKSFRGQLASGGIETVPLRTNTGSIGYKIKKFEALSYYPSGTSPEAVIKIYSIPQATATDTIDFNDNTLLAALFYEGNSNNYYISQVVTIFDNMKFNQDIYVTCTSTDGKMNYYIELEQDTLSIDENTVATLKDIRNITGPV